MQNQDWDVANEILGKHKFLLFPKIENDKEKIQNIPRLNFLNPKKAPEILISNRLVSQGEFISFVNDLIKAGIKLPEIENKLAFFVSETHTAKIDSNGLLIAIEQEKPITHISPLSALAYAKYNGYEIPKQKTYKKLSQLFPVSELNINNATFGDKSKMTRIGVKEKMNGFYDLFGNASEFCCNKSGDYFIIGGSYKDEIAQLNLSYVQNTMYSLRSTETSFRLEPNKKNKRLKKKEVISLIKNTELSKELNQKLLR